MSYEKLIGVQDMTAGNNMVHTNLLILSSYSDAVVGGQKIQNVNQK